MNELMTRQEVMAFLKISKSTLIRLERRGKLAKVRVTPQCIRIPRESVEQFVNRSTADQKR